VNIRQHSSNPLHELSDILRITEDMLRLLIKQMHMLEEKRSQNCAYWLQMEDDEQWFASSHVKIKMRSAKLSFIKL
jgi:hypothetical protein